MTRYSVEFSRTAKKQLLAQDRESQDRILRAIDGLTRNPHPQGCRKLHGSHDTYRIRVGRFRVVYQIEARRLVVLVLKLGHRKDIYR